MLLGHCIFPRAFENNGLCQLGGGGGANKVYYGECEKSEFLDISLSLINTEVMLIRRRLNVNQRYKVSIQLNYLQ